MNRTIEPGKGRGGIAGFPALLIDASLINRSEEGTGVERRVLDLGADDYIIKPFDPAVFLSRVNGVFRRLKVMAA